MDIVRHRGLMDRLMEVVEKASQLQTVIMGTVFAHQNE